MMGRVVYNGCLMGTSFKIQGFGAGFSGQLSGELSVSGAKNAVLPALAASVLVPGPIRFSNIPGIEDVARMSELLEGVGAVVSKEEEMLCVDGVGVSEGNLIPSIATSLRASIFLSGPLLARVGSVSFPHPGGDVIGVRPIDLFLSGFEAMGAEVVYKKEEEVYQISAPRALRGAEIIFPFVSVGATETLMMAAVLTKGTTTLKNAAMEPEVVFLADLLKKSGAHITGAGTPEIIIEGVEKLHAPDSTIAIIPDRIEAGTYAILGALAGKDIVIQNCAPKHIESLTALLKKAGAFIDIGSDSLHITKSSVPLKSVNVRTHEYPGFATDLQAPMCVLLTQASGESVVFETIFEGRLHYTDDLVHMGADITPIGTHRVVIRGPQKLRGRVLEGPDIRAGLAYVLAAIVAEGESVVHNAYHIDRGYQHVEDKLRGVGVAIERINASS